MADGPAFYVYRDRAGEWRWSLVAGNRTILADSGEGYTTHAGCLEAVARVQSLMGDSRLHHHDNEPPPGR
jgi:uncharacterized protein YegP (UPF0339 family)